MILEQIIAHKRTEIARLQQEFAEWKPPARPPVRRSLMAALKRPGISLVAEFKRRSPSRGDIRADANPVAVARTYHEAGAAAMSVLTDERFFGGSVADLTAARTACSLPVLRKDFIVHPAQVAQSAGEPARPGEGPDCLLLIASVFGEGAGGKLLPYGYDLRAMRELAAACGQRALVEVHDEADLEMALEAGAEMIGINNRDLRTFEVSLETTMRLRPRIPGGIVVVSESGIHSREDVRRLEEAGVDAILVGEALMVSGDPRKTIAELMGW